MSILHPEILTRPEDKWPTRILIGGLIVFAVLVASIPLAHASIGDNEDRHQSVASTYHKTPHKTTQKRKKTPVSLTKKRDVKPEKSLSVVAADTSLVAKARSYIGTNPTGWRSLWCGRFMAMVAPVAARRVRNPNMARDWAQLPHVGAKVGVIAVLSRGNGGHVGVVSGFDKNGNPRIISGNHNHVVGEGIYPKSRVIAYVAALDQVAMVR